MEFVMQRPNAGKSATRIAVVIALHLVMAYGLMNGMNRQNALKLPPTSIEYVNIVPEPPKAVELPKPVVQKVSAPVLTPPVVTLENPPVAETIAVPETPPPSGATESSASPAGESSTTPSTGISAACPNSQAIRENVRYPAQARREGIEGDVVARFTVGATGAIRDVAILSSSNRLLNASVVQAVQQFSCVGQGRDVLVEVPFSFRLQ